VYDFNEHLFVDYKYQCASFARVIGDRRNRRTLCLDFRFGLRDELVRENTFSLQSSNGKTTSISFLIAA
jgi:hypothetical protein